MITYECVYPQSYHENNLMLKINNLFEVRTIYLSISETIIGLEFLGFSYRTETVNF
jgi:hypothetical protein